MRDNTNDKMLKAVMDNFNQLGAGVTKIRVIGSLAHIYCEDKELVRKALEATGAFRKVVVLEDRVVARGGFA